MPTLTFEPIPVPLRYVEGGAVRVGDSRVDLAVAMAEYHDGADPESIANAYPTLRLADVYAVIAYYLRNREAVDAYTQGRREAADRLRGEIEAKHPDRRGLREKLLARRAEMEQAHASPGQ